MPLSPLQFDHLLSQPGLVHGCFDRHGGCSNAPHDSLNVGVACGDRQEDALANRQSMAALLGLKRLLPLQQVHGDRVVLVDETSPADQPADAMISTSPGLGLLIQQADCQAVLLYDPGNRVVANIHVGWRGQVAELIGKTVAIMEDECGCRPEQLLAAISPSLGPCCAQFVNYEQEFPGHFHDLQVKPLYFDLWRLSGRQLEACGIRPDSIAQASVCTCCNRNYFSYRRSKVTGRCGSVIGLRHG